MTIILLKNIVCPKLKFVGHIYSWFFKKKKNYLLLAALGFCCCVWAFFNCGEGGHLLVVVGRLLIVMASFAAKYRL